jgi:hypothetical protein
MSLDDQDDTLRQTRPELSFGQRMHLIAQQSVSAKQPVDSLPVYPESLLTRGEPLSIWKRRGSLFGSEIVLHSGLRTDMCIFLRHPNLECVIGASESGELITEYLPRGSAKFLNAAAPPLLTLRLILGACAGLEFLRARGLAGKGRGLSPGDVLISAHWEARLSQRLLLLPESPADCDVSGVRGLLTLLLPPGPHRPNSLSAAITTVLEREFNFDQLFHELRILAKRDSDFADEAVNAFILGV